MHSTLRRLAAATIVSLLTSLPASAAFHFAVIDEVLSGFGGDPTIQYVEIRMLSAGQTVVANTRLAAFNCDASAVTRLLLTPSDIGNGMAGGRWIIASPSFQAAAGIAPDFVMESPSPGIHPDCGMICWGAPGEFPPDPMSWDPTVPGNYVDCVAYGPYTGPLAPGSGAILTSTPNNDGTQSLTRAGGSAFDNGFTLAAPSPTNNAGQVGTLGGGGGTTTSTTTGGGVTTTTVGPALLGGGSVKTDCASEWRVAGATGTKPVVKCTDNDPTCDVSAAQGCVFRTQLCFNDASQPIYKGKCTASPVSAFALTGNVDPAVGAAVTGALPSFAAPLSSLACSGAIDISVPLKLKGTKLKKGSLNVKSTATATKPDKDKLKLICQP